MGGADREPQRRHTLSALYPPDIAAALADAAHNWPVEKRFDRIDALTDELVRLGLCRPRGSQGVFRGGRFPFSEAANEGASG